MGQVCGQVNVIQGRGNFQPHFCIRRCGARMCVLLCVSLLVLSILIWNFVSRLSSSAVEENLVDLVVPVEIAGYSIPSLAIEHKEMFTSSNEHLFQMIKNKKLFSYSLL